MAMNKNLLGGSLGMLLLHLLNEKDRYGYDIIRELEVRSEAAFVMQEGTLYPVLHKLENKGLVKSYMTESETGRKRKYYKITDRGIKQLSEEKEEFERFAKSVRLVVGSGSYGL